MNDMAPEGNTWANQALFDYEGNVLPALEMLKNIHKINDRGQKVRNKL